MFFGRKKPEGKTVLLLDVENGSVAAGLARLEPEGQPRIFGALRKNLPLSQSPTAASLTHAVTKAAREVLHHASTVAARMRGSEKLAPLGVVSSTNIFLSAPWTTFDDGWSHEEALAGELSEAVEEYFGDTRAAIYPFGRALASTTGALFQNDEPVLFLPLPER